MRKPFLYALLLGAFYAGQTQNITGRVIDEQNDEPLIGATVLLQKVSKGSVTNIDGEFTIENVKDGSYNLQISFYGYEKIKQSVTVSGSEVDLGELSLKPATIGLEEVEVFADVVEERKTPIAISTISGEELDERYNNVSLAEAVQNTPGVYTIQGNGGYGDQEVYIRGFNQTNVAFLVNGIPVNDMENGRMFWSNFAGLNQVTRTTQVQRGLGASKLAISSIGGTVNMITKPSDRSAGGRIEYMTGTGTWNNRLRFTYNTGQSDNGWAFSFQGTKTTTTGARDGLPSEDQGPILPGAFVDAWSYYISASKQINKKHQIMFWAFGAPFNRGSAWTVDDQTREDFNIDQPMFNNALGIKNGELFNARQNKVHKPLTAITHYWDINRNTNLTTSVYFSRARVYSTQPRDAGEGLFLPERGQLAGNEITTENLINWDYLTGQNRSEDREVTVPFPNGDPNIESLTGFNSRYYLESRHNNHDWIGVVSNYTKQLNKIRIRGGLDLRAYRGEHYAEVFDLMGGDFILNQSRFTNPTPDQKSSVLNPGLPQVYNKLQGENPVAYEGDKTNYNYDGIVNWASAFGQAEAIFGKFILFGSATITYSDMQRVGHFWSGNEFLDYEENSLGKSEKKTFLTYILKTGVNYKIDGRNNVFVNFGHFTRPPFLRNAFVDARYSNDYRSGLKKESVYSAEAGYGFKTPYLKANLNGYYLIWQDRTTQVNLPSPDQNETADIPLVLNGMVSEHKGIELDFVANPTASLELNGYLGIGEWIWKEVPNQRIIVGGQEFLTDDEFNVNTIEGLPVGTAAQTTAGIGFHFRGIRSTYIGGRLNYADRIPINYTLEDVAEGFITAEVIEDEFDDYHTVTIYAGRYFDVGEDMSGRISFYINNLFNAEYTRWASFFAGQLQRAFGYPRTYTIGLSLDF